jgi:CRISPR/Cas system CMR-associated protein Cmr5 small subunit
MMWGAMGGSAIVSGIVLALFAFFLNRKDKKDDARAKTAQEESLIIMKNIQGIGHLAEATAIGHKTQHFNSNIDDALEYYHNSRDEMNDYLLRQNAVANH